MPKSANIYIFADKFDKAYYITKRCEDYNFIFHPYIPALNVEGKKCLRRESINDIGHDVCPLVVTSRTHDALLAREYHCM